MSHASDALQDTQHALDLSSLELWWRYFALGGDRSPLEIEAILFGALVPTADDHDLLATALNEQPRAPGSVRLPLTVPASGPSELGPPDRAPAPRPSHAANTWVVLLERSVTSPQIARRTTQRWLTASACPPGFIADVVLVVSELVTNAVEHAVSAALLRAHLDHDRLRLEVHDNSTAAPVLKEPGEHARRAASTSLGAGLHIVEALSDAWGWTSTPTGKSVWTEHRWSSPVDAAPGSPAAPD